VIVTHGSLNDVFAGFKTSFNKGFAGARTFAAEVAMTVPSNSAEERYGWLGSFPRLREWIGDRHVVGLAVSGHTIVNRKFEVTLAVPKTDIEDDRYGVYGPAMEEMGRAAAEHPDELLFGLLAAGFATPCYDGQYFFDTDHPVGGGGGLYPVRSVANTNGGAGTPWFLLDCSRAVRPLVWQSRTGYVFTKLDDERDENVFWRDQYVYGCRARASAGFALWQLAYASRQPLDTDGYEAARVAMAELRGDEGEPLGVRPTHLVVPPSLEKRALELLNATHNAAGASNVWSGTAKLIVSQRLAA
jgi:phage major head subunit gpT-like protein